MGKKVRTRSKITSKGQRPSVSNKTLRIVKEGVSEGDKLYNKLIAWRSGKNGWITIPNPNPNETDRRFIRVSFNSYFGKGRDFKTIKFGDNTSSENRNEL
jgi:hypothetical protein